MERIETSFNQEKIEELNKVKIITYFDLLDQDEINEKIMNEFLSLNPKEQEEYLRIYFKIDLKTNTNIKALFENEVNLYISKSQKLKEKQNDYYRNLIEWSRKNNILFGQSIDNVKVISTSKALNEFLNIKGEKIYADSMFDHKTNTIYIEASHPQETLVHEYVHAASLMNGQQVGFIDFKKNKNNYWLNEGCTLMIEKEIIGNFNHRPTDGEDLYVDGFYWLTVEFIKKLGIDKHILYKAYFGEENSRQELEAACNNEFNCSFNDLSELLIGFSPEIKSIILKIINGDIVELKNKKHYVELAQIFKNIVIKN